MTKSINHKVLLIDDDVAIINLASTMLASTGFHVLSSTSADQGLEMARAIIPHIILLDINMPKINGLEFLKRIMEMPETAHIPVVMMSAVHDKRVVLESVSLGAHDYVLKPFTNTTLVLKVKKNLKDRRQYSYRFQDPDKPTIPAVVSGNLLKASEVEMAFTSPIKIANNATIGVDCAEMGLTHESHIKTVRSFHSNSSSFISIVKLIGTDEDMANIIRQKIARWSA